MKDSPFGTTSASNKPNFTELFHRINSVIPNDQVLETVAPETSAEDALKILNERGFSQLPIVKGREVLGVFSYRSYARSVLRHAKQASANKKFDPLTLLVEDCREDAEFARLTDEFKKWFDHIDRFDAILVGDPNRLLAIVTAMDILQYLYVVASPFVLIAESELALRALIRYSVDENGLAECANRCLSEKYEVVPSTLEDMTFNDYVQIVTDGRNWEHFQPTFGGDRSRTRARLEYLGGIRNDVFHFKREITVEDYEGLAEARDWMLIKARTVEASREENQ